MQPPVLTTKLFRPTVRPKSVNRPRLLKLLNAGLNQRLTLVAAPAGSGKTALLSQWAASCGRPVAWLSLDEKDASPERFLTYVIAGVQTVLPDTGKTFLIALQSPQPPRLEFVAASWVNEITAAATPFVLVLDDYHVLDSQAVDQLLLFLLENLPASAHVVLATRQDPDLPLARWRAKGELAEVRAAELKFPLNEAAEFFKHTMGLKLAPEDAEALEARTEGWIAGLQLAALSLQGHGDAAGFVKSFAGSHRFVMDFLMEEVWHKQPAATQRFLLATSILPRLCGPLCEAVLEEPGLSGQETLEKLEQANLFILKLDQERRWYRYHHLFAELLRQRLQQDASLSSQQAELHVRASQWFEDQGLDLEAFQHAAAGLDYARVERLLDSGRIPLHLHDRVTQVQAWLASLPPKVKDARPSLWVRQGTLRLILGQSTGVEDVLRSAEKALLSQTEDAKNRNLLGQIATARATLALSTYQFDTILTQAERALEYLLPENLAFRTSTLWMIGLARMLTGDRVGAQQAFTDSLAMTQQCGDLFTAFLDTLSLGQLQEMDNQLPGAERTYRALLQGLGDQPLPHASELHLGLARVLYQWNELDAAQHHAEQALKLALQYEQGVDRFVLCEVLLARVQMARRNFTGAADALARTDRAVQEHRFQARMPEVAAAQVVLLLRQNHTAAAARLAQKYPLPDSLARVSLAKKDAAGAVAVLKKWLQQAETKHWEDERLKATLLLAVALLAQGEKPAALKRFTEALEQAEPGGHVRLFVDEGEPVSRLLALATDAGVMPGYVAKLQAAFAASEHIAQPLAEPLTSRELEVIRLVAAGFSNEQISQKLFRALSTIKGHVQVIFEKLQVQRRTEAVAKARELGLLPAEASAPPPRAKKTSKK